MANLIKADFHLHTCYSDNLDRMLPEEFATLAVQAGYTAIGFCDHHHNLTQESWWKLRAAAESLTTPDLLISTGYEATFATGHLCVLDKTEFDGATAAQCERQIWNPDTLRIVAHPDNNACAWRLPLPVDAAGVEIINGGQDLYSYRPSSPCNGLHTYQAYLLLDHPIAAIGQSDCHQRAFFGRAWTGLWLPAEHQPTLAAIFDAVGKRCTFAAMGDVQLRVWCEEAAHGRPLLRWHASEGVEIYIHCMDRPVAYVDPMEARRGVYEPVDNGYYWLLVRRGSAWAVSSPVLVHPLPGDSAQAARGRTTLLSDSLVRRHADELRYRLDQLQVYQSDWSLSPFPVGRYIEWLSAQLPERWRQENYIDAPDELRRQALLRLARAHSMAGAVLENVLRHHHRARVGPHDGVQVVLAPQENRAGAVQFVIDVPRTWAGISITDPEGRQVPALAMPVDGERDPVKGQRTRSQMHEIVTWLNRGEIHEYVVMRSVITRHGASVSVTFDLYTAELAWQPTAYPEMAAELTLLLLDEEVAEFYVDIRMPLRYAILLQVERAEEVNLLTAHEAAFYGANDAPLPPDFIAGTLAAVDCLGAGVVVQLG